MHARVTTRSRGIVNRRPGRPVFHSLTKGTRHELRPLPVSLSCTHIGDRPHVLPHRCDARAACLRPLHDTFNADEELGKVHLFPKPGEMWLDLRVLEIRS